MTAAARLNALLVDADEISRREILAQCRESGWECDCLQEPGRLFEAAGEKHYDLVIAELPVAQFSIEELLLKLRSANPQQAVVVITNDAKFENAIAELRDTTIGVIAKPVSREALKSWFGKIVTTAGTKARKGTMSRFLASERSSYEFRTADLTAVHPALPIAERLMQSGKIDESTRKRLEVAFQEALTNACDHGNLELESSWREIVGADGSDQYTAIRKQRLSDPQFGDRRVIVSTDYDEKRLKIRIRDQGPGFTPPDAPTVRQSTQCHGRGLPIIYQTMDEVWHEQGGREVVMVKYLPFNHQTKER